MPSVLARLVVGLLFVGLLVAIPSTSAHAVVKPTITLFTSSDQVEIGSRVILSGNVSGPSVGVPLRLEERTGTSGWTTAASARVNSKSRFRFNRQVNAETVAYRVVSSRTALLRPSVSRAVKVRGVDPAPDSPPDRDLADIPYDEMQNDFFNRLVDYRVSNGKDSVEMVSELSDFAIINSYHQAEQDQLGTRTSFPPGSVAGYSIKYEIASLSGVPRDAFRAMASSYSSELLGDYERFGVGIVLRDDNSAWWTVTFADSTPLPPMILDEVRSDILQRTNQYRAEVNLPPLVMMDELNTVAQAWTEHMAANKKFEHSPDFYKRYPVGWHAAGENIAMGYLPYEVTEGWYASPGHRANMQGDFTHIGIGVAWDDRGVYYYTQNFALY